MIYQGFEHSSWKGTLIPKSLLYLIRSSISLRDRKYGSIQLLFQWRDRAEVQRTKWRIWLGPMDSTLTWSQLGSNRAYIWFYNWLTITHILPTSGSLLHSMTISQKSIGHRPILMLCIILGLLMASERTKHKRVYKTWIVTLVTMNLQAILTVPSCFSCIIAVGI